MPNKEQILPDHMPHGSLTGFGLCFIALCLFVYILQAGAAILIPFAIAVYVWYLINALARFLGRVRLGGKALPSFARFLFAILILCAGFWFGYKLIVTNAAAVMTAAPEYQKKFQDFLPRAIEWLPASYRPAPGEIGSFLNVGGFITALVKTFTGIAGKTLVVLFYTGFLLYEQRFFGYKLHEITGSARAEKRVHDVIHNIDMMMQRYIGLKTFLSAMTGVSSWLLLKYVGIDFAAFWGMMTFILNFIPYVGSIAAVVLPAIIALVQFGDLGLVCWVAFCLSFIQLFWSNLLDPRLLGRSLNLSPICIIFSLALWGMVWGVPGMFLAVPILAMIVIILSQFDSTRGFAVLLTKTGEITAPAERKRK